MIYMEQPYKFLYFIFFPIPNYFLKNYLPIYIMYFKHLSGLQRVWNHYDFICRIEVEKTQKNKNLAFIKRVKIFLIH